MRYRVDLKRFMAECEANYVRLKRLFPAMGSANARLLGLSGFDNRHFQLRVCERSPYTTLLSLSLEGRSVAPWMDWPEIQVRLYHDARLAEVVGVDQRRRVKPRNPYPNRHMYQRDEKYQWNRFLGELLAFCQTRGYVLPDALEVVNG